MQEEFKLLRNKEIIAILDGDTKYEDITFDDDSSVKIAMPYLSGPDLCALSSLFGLPETYSWGGVSLSRWQYLDNLLGHCIKNDRCSDLLAHMFSKDQFSKDFSSEPLPQYFSTAEAQECFTLYQIGIANVSEKESYWKPLG